MKYRFLTLYSGSSGNSTLISDGNSTVLIDAGKSARSLCSALTAVGSGIEKIDAIFITHEHCDHVSALETLAKKHRIPVHITEGSAKKFDRYPDSPLHSVFVRHDTCFCETVGNITVRSFRTPHDSNMRVGYRIELEDEDGKHVLGVATDIGYVTEDIREGLMGCEAVVLESNHDIGMLDEGPYPYYLKQRIRSQKGHLSNKDSAIFAGELAANGTRGFILAHLSRENNHPQIAFDEINSVICDPSVCIVVADPDTPTELNVTQGDFAYDGI